MPLQTLLCVCVCVYVLNTRPPKSAELLFSNINLGISNFSLPLKIFTRKTWNSERLEIIGAGKGSVQAE